MENAGLTFAELSWC